MSDPRTGATVRLSERIAEIRVAANEAGAARLEWMAAFKVGDHDRIDRAMGSYRTRQDRLTMLAERLETDGIAEFLEAWITLEEELRGLRVPEPRKPTSDLHSIGL